MGSFDSGFDAGTTMYQRAIDNKLRREQADREAEAHDARMAAARFEQGQRDSLVAYGKAVADDADYDYGTGRYEQRGVKDFRNDGYQAPVQTIGTDVVPTVSEGPAVKKSAVKPGAFVESGAMPPEPVRNAHLRDAPKSAPSFDALIAQSQGVAMEKEKIARQLSKQASILLRGGNIEAGRQLLDSIKQKHYEIDIAPVIKAGEMAEAGLISAEDFLRLPQIQALHNSTDNPYKVMTLEGQPGKVLGINGRTGKSEVMPISKVVDMYNRAALATGGQTEKYFAAKRQAAADARDDRKLQNDTMDSETRRNQANEQGRHNLATEAIQRAREAREAQLDGLRMRALQGDLKAKEAHDKYVPELNKIADEIDTAKDPAERQRAITRYNTVLGKAMTAAGKIRSYLPSERAIPDKIHEKTYDAYLDELKNLQPTGDAARDKAARMHLDSKYASLGLKLNGANMMDIGAKAVGEEAQQAAGKTAAKPAAAPAIKAPAQQPQARSAAIDLRNDPTLKAINEGIRSLNPQDPANTQKLMALGTARNERIRQLQASHGDMTQIITE